MTVKPAAQAAAKPTHKKLGPICSGLRGATRTLSAHSFGKRGKSSSLAEQIADATFGDRAKQLAEANWHTTHGSEDGPE